MKRKIFTIFLILALAFTCVLSACDSGTSGGNGGGKPDFAMAGAKDLTKIDEALAAVEEFVAKMLTK